jgi:5-methylthioadenosine/S-adenosylhomocysteine deaminase
MNSPGSCEDGGCEILRNHDIEVRGNRIAAIVSRVGPGHVPDSQVNRGRGMLAIPGLINTHAHVPMGVFRGLVEDVDLSTWFDEFIWPLESNLTADDVFWDMQLGLAETIEACV